MAITTKIHIGLYQLLLFCSLLLLSATITANSNNNDSSIILDFPDSSNIVRYNESVIDSFISFSQYDSAYFYYTSYINKRDSVYEKERLKSIKNLIEKYKIIESESQARILSQKLWNRTLILIFSASLTLLIIVLLILTFSRYKLKTKIYAKETSKLNITIEEKNKELILKVKDQNKQNEIFEIISSSINSINKARDLEKLRKPITELRDDLSKKNKKEMSWDSFKVYFEQVHPYFFDKLLRESDALTQKDLRISAYIKLNLSTKDISNVLNISDRAIQTSRYRIKKKLNLPPDTDLVKFIQSI